MIPVLQRKAGEISETLKKIQVKLNSWTEGQRSPEYEINKKRTTKVASSLNRFDTLDTSPSFATLASKIHRIIVKGPDT